jgi:hypothetical protein
MVADDVVFAKDKLFDRRRYRMRRALSLASLLTLLTVLPAGAARPTGPVGGPPTRLGPVKIILLDGCVHAQVQQEVAKSRTAVPLELNTSAKDLGTCQLDPAKAQAAITELTKTLDVERRKATQRRAPVPITIVYTGAFLEGGNVASSWNQAVQRLSKIALIVSPGGNNAQLGASQVWPSSQHTFKVGNAPDGTPAGSTGPQIGIYVNYAQPLAVVVDGSNFSAAGSSTAAMLVSSHLANLFKAGVAKKYTPEQVLSKLKAAFTERVLTEAELEARLRVALR